MGWLRPETHSGVYLPYLQAFLGQHEARAQASAKGVNSTAGLGEEVRLGYKSPTGLGKKVGQ